MDSIQTPWLGLAALAVAAVAPAQRVLSVGAGRSFADPAAALAVARDGDLLRVDSGTYPPFVVDGVAVSIVPANPGGIRIVSTSGPALEVRRIPAGRDLVLVGFDVAWLAGPGPAVRIGPSPGRVLLRDARVLAAADHPAASARAMVTVEDCGAVWLNAVRISANRFSGSTTSTWPSLPGDDGLPALFVSNTPATFDDVDIGGFGRADANALRAGPGLRAVEGPPLRFSQAIGGSTMIVGGSGGRFGGDAVQLLGGAQGPIRYCGPVEFLPGRGGQGVSGQLAFDGDRGLIQAGGTTIGRVVPGCRWDEFASARIVSPAPAPGTSLVVDVWSLEAPRAYVLLASTGLDAMPPARGAFQGFLLAPAPLAIVSAGVLAAPFGRARWSVPLPPNPGLRGLRLAFQPVLAPAGAGGTVFGFADATVIR